MSLLWFVLSQFCLCLLHVAAGRDDDAKAIELLVAFDADLECVSSSGYTPLLGTARGNVNAVRLLLELNADTTKRSRDGWTVSQTDNEEIKRLLLEHSKKSVRNWISILFRSWFNVCVSLCRNQNENKLASKHSVEFATLSAFD